jgi:hypothetical protein
VTDEERMRAAQALAQHLMSGGQQGEMPDWYPTLQAAKYMGVGPWEIVAAPDAPALRRERNPAIWRDRALVAMLASEIVARTQAALMAQRPKVVLPA